MLHRFPFVPAAVAWRIARKRAWKRYHKDAFQNDKRARAQFHKRNGYAPNFDSPTTHNERTYIRKLRDHDPRFREITDKVGVRNFIDRQLGAGQANALCVPILAQADHFDSLPDAIWDQDVILKCTHGSGMNIVVRKGDAQAKAKARRLTRQWLGRVHGARRFEWAYFDLKPSVIAEPLLGELTDLKLFMYNGQVEYVMHKEDGDPKPLLGIYSPQWDFLNFSFEDFGTCQPGPPKELPALIKLAEQLSKNFDMLRVDFLTTGDRFYLGELTVYDGSGLGTFDTIDQDNLFAKAWTQQHLGFDQHES